jgi:hypothetical protein
MEEQFGRRRGGRTSRFNVRGRGSGSGRDMTGGMFRIWRSSFDGAAFMRDFNIF